MSNSSRLGFVLALALALGSGCLSKSQRSAPSASLPAAAPAPTASVPAKPSGFDAQIKQAAAAARPPVAGEGWRPLFDGRTLVGWRETPFAGRGEVECRDGLLILNMGDPFTGLNGTNDFPRRNYEIVLDAIRLMGTDFFCGLTIPIEDSFCSLIVGGWGGSLVGISSIDGLDASENETTKFMNFENGRWYRIRLRVTANRIEGWIDDDKLIDVVTTGRRLSLRLGDIELSKPFGLASYQTTAAFRNLQLRTVTAPASKARTSE